MPSPDSRTDTPNYVIQDTTPAILDVRSDVTFSFPNGVNLPPKEWAISIQPAEGPHAGQYCRIGYDGTVEASLEPSEAAKLFAQAVGPMMAAYRVPSGTPAPEPTPAVITEAMIDAGVRAMVKYEPVTRDEDATTQERGEVEAILRAALRAVSPTPVPEMLGETPVKIVRGAAEKLRLAAYRIDEVARYLVAEKGAPEVDQGDLTTGLRLAANELDLIAFGSRPWIESLRAVSPPAPTPTEPTNEMWKAGTSAMLADMTDGESWHPRDIVAQHFNAGLRAALLAAPRSPTETPNG